MHHKGHEHEESVVNTNKKRENKIYMCVGVAQKENISS